MDKIITVHVKGEDQLIKYSKSTGEKGNVVFKVETTIPKIAHFSFWVEGKQAAFPLTTDEENEIRISIMRAIDKNEMKK